MYLTLRKLARQCYIFSVSDDDDNLDEVTKRQKRYMELFREIGGTDDIIGILTRRMQNLEQFIQYNALIHKETALNQPIIDAENKTRRQVDVEKLR